MATSDIKKGPLYVDSTNNRVGIGTSSPDTNLDVERSSNDTGGIKVQNTNNTQGNAVAQVEISGGDNAYANLLLECNATNHSIRQDGSGNLKITNGLTERLRIDSSGRVTMPSQPSFLAYGSWSYDTNYFWKGFATVDHNIGSHWNNTTGVWTCPIAGRYMIYATMYHDSSSNYHLWTFYKNSAAFAPWIQDYNQVSGENTTSSTAIINCAANDTLQFNSNASYANAYIGGYNKVGVCLMG